MTQASAVISKAFIVVVFNLVGTLTWWYLLGTYLWLLLKSVVRYF